MRRAPVAPPQGRGGFFTRRSIESLGLRPGMNVVPEGDGPPEAGRPGACSGDPEAGQVGRRCCSMYALMMVSGAPPQDAAK
jgi:hypothetical protein